MWWGRRIWSRFWSIHLGIARICAVWSMGTSVIPRCVSFWNELRLTTKPRITKPLFVIAGKNDPRVPASESEQMAQIVRQNGTPVWWLLGKNEGHGFRKKQNVDYQFYATVM